MNKLCGLGLVSILSLGLLGCGSSGSKARSPHWGKDICKVCRMAVSEKRPSAQLLGPGAQVRYFDDLGCAVNAMLRGSAPAQAKLYVLAPGGNEQWVEADKIRFEAGVKTPMDYGYLPKQDGSLSLQEVVAQIRAKYGESWRLPQR